MLPFHTAHTPQDWPTNSFPYSEGQYAYTGQFSTTSPNSNSNHIQEPGATRYQADTIVPAPQSTGSLDTAPVSFAQATYQSPSQIDQPYRAFGQWQSTSYPLSTPVHEPSLLATPTAATAATAATTETATSAERSTMHYRRRTERMRVRAHSYIQSSGQTPGIQQNLAMVEDVETVEDGVYFLIFVPHTNNYT